MFPNFCTAIISRRMTDMGDRTLELISQMGSARRRRASAGGSSAGTSRADSFNTRAAYAPHKILWSLKRGQPTKATFKQLCAAVAAKEFNLHIDLNLGKAAAIIYGADLTEKYVEFNKGDVSDPASLGG